MSYGRGSVFSGRGRRYFLSSGEARDGNGKSYVALAAPIVGKPRWVCAVQCRLVQQVERNINGSVGAVLCDALRCNAFDTSRMSLMQCVIIDGCVLGNSWR